MCWCCSIFYVCATCCDLDVTIRRRAWQKLRGNDNSPSHVPPKRKEAIKSGISGCGSFVVPCFQPATSIDLYIWRWQAGLEVGKLNSIRPTGNEPLMVTAIEVKGKEHNGQPDEQEKELHRGGSVPGLHTTQDKFWQGECVLAEAGCSLDLFRPHSLDLTGCRVLYEIVRMLPQVLAGCFLVACPVFSDVWNLTGCLAVMYLRAGGEAHWRPVPQSTKLTGSSFLHPCLWTCLSKWCPFRLDLSVLVPHCT